MLRDADPGDAAAIAAIWNPVIRDTLATFNAVEKTPKELGALIEARQSQGLPFLVAEEGAVLGFASYAQFRGGVGYAHSMEHTVMLAPAAQGRGLGRVLMQALEQHARAAGVHSLIAGISGANPQAIAFHAALGFAPVAVLPQVGRKSGQWLDLHLMQKFM